MDRIHETLALAQDLGHPFSQGRALLFTPAIHLLRREGAEAYGHAGQVSEGLSLLEEARILMEQTGERFCSE